MKRLTSPSQKTGLIGENIATQYLKNKNFSIIERNYSCELGEIDIIAEKDSVVSFIEVKSGYYDSSAAHKERYNPGENFNKKKYAKMIKTANQYKKIKNVSYETNFMLIIVHIDKCKKKHLVEVIDPIIF
jgi:putative endonuclease